MPGDHIDAPHLVLVADDEAALRRSLTLMLRGAGFETLEAHDGVDAVEHVRTRGLDIAAVLLDASMPVMGGVEAARRIRALRADLPIAMMTGYSQDVFVGVETITKPFEPEALLQLLRRLTGAPPPSA